MGDKKFIEVTVAETYTRTFRVLAIDNDEAADIVVDAINSGEINCDEGKGYHYSMELTEFQDVKDKEYVNTYESEGFLSKGE